MSAEARDAAPLVGVVVVNWNGWRDTLVSYERLQLSMHDNWVFIVVDNASSDESVGKLRELGPRSILIESSENLGFAGACNVGIARAEQLGADYIYLLNNDAFVTPQTLQSLISASRELNDKAVLGSVIRYERGDTLQFWGARASRMTGLPRKFPASEPLFASAGDRIESDFIMGASLFAHRDVFARVGPFDDRFFLNYEETDWCYRARRFGFPSIVLKNAVVQHKGGASIGDPNGPLQIYFMRRNRALFGEKNCAPHQFAMIYLHQVLRSLAQVPRFIFDRRPSSAGWRMISRADFRATLDYTFRRFGDCPTIIRELAANYRALR